MFEFFIEALLLPFELGTRAIAEMRFVLERLGLNAPETEPLPLEGSIISQARPLKRAK
jgi:hypothetical protein